MKTIQYICYILLCTILIASCSGTSEPQGSTFPEPGSFRGRIIEAKLIGSRTAEQLQQFLNKIPLPIRMKYGIALYNIRYQSIKADGTPVQLSGTIAIPQEVESMPLLCYNHATVTEKDSIPTKQGFNLEATVMGGSGYCVVQPDYHGFGADSSSVHPFLHDSSHAAAAIDLLRAAKTLSRTLGTKLNNQLFITGYSQGGYATMSVHRAIERFYRNEFTVTASAALAGPYNIEGTFISQMLNGNSYPFPGYTAMLLLGYDSIYDIYDSLQQAFREPFASRIPQLFNGKTPLSAIHNQLSSSPRSLFTSQFLLSTQTFPNFPLRLALQQNNNFRWRPQAQLRLYHCTADEQVPISNSREAYTAMLASGATSVRLIELGLQSHTACAVPAFLGAKMWFDSLATITALP